MVLDEVHSRSSQRNMTVNLQPFYLNPKKRKKKKEKRKESMEKTKGKYYITCTFDKQSKTHFNHLLLLTEVLLIMCNSTTECLSHLMIIDSTRF